MKTRLPGKPRFRFELAFAFLPLQPPCYSDQTQLLGSLVNEAESASTQLEVTFGDLPSTSLRAHPSFRLPSSVRTIVQSE